MMPFPFFLFCFESLTSGPVRKLALVLPSRRCRHGAFGGQSDPVGFLAVTAGGKHTIVPAPRRVCRKGSLSTAASVISAFTTEGFLRPSWGANSLDLVWPCSLPLL